MNRVVATDRRFVDGCGVVDRIFLLVENLALDGIEFALYAHMFGNACNAAERPLPLRDPAATGPIDVRRPGPVRVTGGAALGEGMASSDVF